jgi:hypothetical protein
MRIATWNVQLAPESGKRARLFEWIERTNADVWVLTQTLVDLRPSSMHREVHTAGGGHGGQPGEVAAAIWSRHPIRALSGASDPARAVAALVTLPEGELIVYAAGIICEPDREDWLRLRREHPAAEFCVAGQVNDNLATLEDAFISAQLACVTHEADDPVAAQSGGAARATSHIALSADFADRVSASGCWPAGTEPLPDLSTHFGIFVDIE